MVSLMCTLKNRRAFKKLGKANSGGNLSILCQIPEKCAADQGFDHLDVTRFPGKHALL